jgi:hypothetical protein
MLSLLSFAIYFLLLVYAWLFYAYLDAYYGACFVILLLDNPSLTTACVSVVDWLRQSFLIMSKEGRKATNLEEYL